jgi:hypothetical protein
VEVVMAVARVLVVGLALLGAACGIVPAKGSEIRVQSELLPWAQVSGYHTYRWWTPPIVESSGRYTEREAKLDWRVRGAVDAALGARGYVQDATRPDFIVTYHASVSSDYTSSFQDYVAYRAEGGTQDMGGAFMRYERGTLMLEFTDAASRRVVWRATASTVLEGDAAKRIDPAVQQMIARFPGTTR